MEINKVKKLIEESKNPNWYKNEFLLKARLLMANDVQLKGFTSAYQFFIDQATGFLKFNENIEPLEHSKNVFQNIVQRLDNFLEENRNHDTSSLDNALNSLQNKVDGMLADLNYPVFYSDSVESEFLNSLKGKSPETITAAVHYLVNKSLEGLTRPNYLLGALLAYEFRNSDSSHITERTGKERSSVDKIRLKFQEFINKGQVELDSILNTANLSTNELLEANKILMQESDLQRSNWFKSSEQQLTKLFDDIEIRRNGFESTYTDLIRLKKPAEYWAIRAKKLKEESKTWLNWLIGSILFSVAILITLIVLITSDTLEKVFNSPSSMIRWSIAFLVLISFLAYAIRTFNKLLFSTQHLSRDAEEREQLTYVYLALINETSETDKESRLLILNSLFSRSDTGLLKEDSSPSMPGVTGLIEKVGK